MGTAGTNEGDRFMKVRFALAGIAATALGVATIASLPAAYAGGGEKDGMMHADKRDIIDTAVGPGMQEVTTVVTAIKAAGLVDTLKGPGPFTVFAPTNDAFKKLPPGTVEDLLKPENKAKLTQILTYHVHAGDAIMARDVKTMNLSTVEGSPLMVKTSADGVWINNAKVVKTDVVCSNGVIHWIDTVVMPPQ
jgi:uncharacterized surface protein with fasciclin (FAS1) repeats